MNQSVSKLCADATAAVRANARAVWPHLLTVLWGGSVRQYRPEAHYMRGPGPKWREKHGAGEGDTRLVKNLALMSDRWGR